MKAISKKEKAKENISKLIDHFKCPICHEQLVINDYHLSCLSGHTFDLAKKGYINLLTSHNIPVYSKALFESRHQIINAGFYQPLINQLVTIINQYYNSNDPLSILDAGCGEGSHLTHLYQLKEMGNYFGIDISKDSIQIAAHHSSDIIWCVADLAKLPFQNKKYDIILNILTPANYHEFLRILADDGLIIKIVPGQSYLKEIRHALYHDTDTLNYNNTQVVDYFNQQLEVVDTKNLVYKFSLNQELLTHLLKMTPLTWKISEEEMIQVTQQNLSSITVDLVILIGKKKKINW